MNVIYEQEELYEFLEIRDFAGDSPRLTICY